MTTVNSGTLLEIREVYCDSAKRTQRVSEWLASGDVSAQTQDNDGFRSEHEIATDSAAVRAQRAAEFQFRYDARTRRSDVVATRGDLVLRAAGRDIPVPESTRIAVEGGKVVETATMMESPRLTTPADQKTFVAPAEAVTLNWSPVEHAGAYRVQVSERPLFRPILHDRRVTEPVFGFPGAHPGSYFWRVSAFDDTGRPGRWSESRSFRVISEGFRDPDDRTPPRLDISEIMVVGTNAIVSGQSEPGSLVWVDGERVDVRDDGRFTWVVKLRADGENKIRFVAQDAAGNETRRAGSAYVDAF
jgi:hypothetical protein